MMNYKNNSKWFTVDYELNIYIYVYTFVNIYGFERYINALRSLKKIT